jgi:hypothetical protein
MDMLFEMKVVCVHFHVRDIKETLCDARNIWVPINTVHNIDVSDIIWKVGEGLLSFETKLNKLKWNKLYWIVMYLIKSSKNRIKLY